MKNPVASPLITLLFAILHAFYPASCCAVAAQALPVDPAANLTAPSNPITHGLHPYGVIDPHVLHHENSFYLVSTNIPHPTHGQEGVVLYQSKDLKHWEREAVLLPRTTVFPTAWYPDGWVAPELHLLQGKWWLTFNNRNRAKDPYGKLGVGIAVADTLTGTYRVVTSDKPLVHGNHFGLLETHDQRIFASWEIDGQIIGAYLDPGQARFLSKPAELFTLQAERQSHRLHVAPHLTYQKGKYFLFYSVFFQGYNIHVAVADRPEGPWQSIQQTPLFSWTEHDAPTELRHAYPSVNTFAPPTEIIGAVQVFTDAQGLTWLAYHSPDKYAEPMLCIDRIDFGSDGTVRFDGRSWKGQPASSSPLLTFAPTIPGQIPLSDRYQVEVLTGGSWETMTVYHSEAAWETNRSKDTAWASVTADGPVRLRVTRQQGDAISDCAVLPSRHTIAVQLLHDSSIEFEVPGPGQYSVEFQKGIVIDHPLLVFVDPPEAPIPADGEIIRFSPGLHELKEPINLKSNQILYLERGAWVRGQVVASNASNIQVRGRGVLDGVRYPAREGNHMIVFREVENALVEGITIVNAPRFNIVMGGANHHVDNVKMLGWWFSTDGVSTGEHSLIENCFFKVNDDAVKLYRSHTTVRNCVIWQMENGAPFMISWNMPTDNAHFHVHNIDIIRVEHQWDNPNLAVVTAIHGSRGTMSDYLFENIRVDNAEWRPFHLITRPNHFGAWDPEQGSIRNFTFRNIEFNGQPRIPSLIMGHDIKHRVENITFENVRINGEALDLNRKDWFTIDPATTRNIKVIP